MTKKCITFTDSALAENLGCEFHDLTDRKKIIRNNTTMTAHGKTKARADDPIRSLADIKKAQEYFLKNGRTKTQCMRNHMIFVLGCSTGLRGGDLLNLRIRDVVAQNGNIKDYIYLIEEKTSKNNDPRINKEAKHAIAMYLDMLGTEIDLDRYLIESNRGGKMDGSQLYRILNKLNTDLGLNYHIGAHTMRKTFAYWTIQMHKNDNRILIALQGMLNHSSPLVTLSYAGITKDEEDSLYDDIGGIF